MAEGKDVEKGGVPWGAVIAGIIAVLALVVIVQNSESTNVQLFGLTIALPLWLMLVIFFLLGVLCNGLVRRGVRKATGRDTKKD